MTARARTSSLTAGVGDPDHEWGVTAAVALQKPPRRLLRSG